MIEATWLELFGAFLVGLWMGLALMASHIIFTIWAERK